jgi:hypothetical protein
VEEPRERVEQTHRGVARGRRDDAPVLALLGVTGVIALTVGSLIAIALVVWLILR